MITEHEYDLLTSSWGGPKGAAFNAAFEFCRQTGLCVGFDARGGTVLTRKGVEAIKAYQAEDNYKRVDVI